MLLPKRLRRASVLCMVLQRLFTPEKASRGRRRRSVEPSSAIGVAACKHNWLGSPTAAFVDSHSVTFSAGTEWSPETNNPSPAARILAVIVSQPEAMFASSPLDICEPLQLGGLGRAR